jgi:hypothetical protein
MKYLITESQLDSLIFRYLDNQDFIQVNYTYETYFVNSSSDRQGVIRYDGRDERCYIDIKLIDEVSSFFSLTFPLESLYLKYKSPFRYSILPCFLPPKSFPKLYSNISFL